MDSPAIAKNTNLDEICADFTSNARHRRTAFGESPRRVLSFSKRRKATVSFPDPDDKAASGFGVSGDHGTKSSEVYGFVGSITTVVATVIFLVWAYVPENWLHTIGIFCYSYKYRALAVPTNAMLTILLALLFYVGLNSMSAPPPSSLNAIFVAPANVRNHFLAPDELHQNQTYYCSSMVSFASIQLPPPPHHQHQHQHHHHHHHTLVSAHLHKTTMYQPNRFKDFPRMSSISSNARPIHSGGSSLASVAPLEAILFDIDGTLCDSDPLHFYAFRDMLQEVSHFPSFDS
ncbi:LOW QUALITY PROTEIN: hypothetical protein NC652_032476 [Populus alba x Populus x berolinensis]|nr:LOW QUALITY PROTEIN: hypothetical protein NC652_032476 [Populus alba x Populus x berolinensis]